MADSENSSQDRSLEPSAKRLADARREGQVPRSRYLSHLMVLGTGVLGLSLVGMHLAQACHTVLVRGLSFDLVSVSRRCGEDPRLHTAAYTALLCPEQCRAGPPAQARGILPGPTGRADP